MEKHRASDDRSHRRKQIFLDALEVELEHRTAFLRAECGEDEDLGREVESLLKAHERAESLISDHGPFAQLIPRHAAALPLHDAFEQPGAEFNGYRLIRALGEGGFGTVWLAEQMTPVRRRVAIKILKLGMDSREVITRFEAERQTLAMMDSPRIAHAYDAGATPSGRPFFVMEYVPGSPVTEYCDERGLDIQARLALFEEVCIAVQHAHQKGVIHRDLKPGNVLITEKDGRALPKVIDFGVAKAVGGLSDRSAITHQHQLIGTPQYMSPEQASLNTGSIDIRSDVYSLGVLLYELLTGCAPFDRTELRASPLELVRLIREKDPPRPSTRISTQIRQREGREPATTDSSDSAIARIAQARRTEPTSLRRRLRGDLDRIVMKAMAKDSAHRYQTADALAKEVRRHLNCEPIEAAPPGHLYRLSKFIQRHRVATAAAAIVILTLSAATVAVAWSVIRSHSAEKRSALAADRTAAANNFMREVLTKARPDRSGVDVKLIDVLEDASNLAAGRFADHPLDLATVREMLAEVYLTQGFHRQAARELESAAGIHLAHHGADARETLGVEAKLVQCYSTLDQPDEVKRRSRELLPRLHRVLGADHMWTLDVRRHYAIVQARGGDWKTGVLELRRVLEDAERAHGAHHASSIATLVSLAGLMIGQAEWGDPAEGEAMLQEAITLMDDAVRRQREQLGRDDLRTLWTMTRLSSTLAAAERYEEAARTARAVLQGSEGRISDQHWIRRMAASVLGSALSHLGEHEEAADWIILAVESYRASLGEDSPNILAHMTDALPVLLEAGRDEKGVEYARALYEAFSTKYDGMGGTLSPRYRAWLAVFLARSGHWQEALALDPDVEHVGDSAISRHEWRQAWSFGRHLIMLEKYSAAERELLRAWKACPENDPEAAAKVASALGDLYDAWGRIDEMARWQALETTNGEKPSGGLDAPPAAASHVKP